MKKKIILIVIASFMFMGVVSAANLWGTYKGNSKIKVYIDKSEYKTSGVPPIIFNGQVMLPLNALKKLNVSYVWDAKKQTAKIENIEPDVLPSAGNEEMIKAYVEAADLYEQLDDLGNWMKDLTSHLSLIYTGYNLGRTDRPDYDRLNEIIDSYNFYVDNLNKLTSNSTSLGVNTQKSNDILNHYFRAIDYYKVAFDSLDNYLLYTTQSSFDLYLDSSNDGFNSVYDGLKIASAEYKSMIKQALSN